nr:hypothetical protein [Tanacetum cinerariifolium]
MRSVTTEDFTQHNGETYKIGVGGINPYHGGAARHRACSHLQAGYDNVYDVGPSVPSKIQCVYRSSSVPCRGPRSHVVMSVTPNTRCVGQLNSVSCYDQGLEVSGVPDVGMSVYPKRRCIRKSSSAACRAQGLPTSRIPFSVGAPSERYHRADDVADTDGFLIDLRELNNIMLGHTLDKSLLLAEIIYVNSHVPPAHHQSTNTSKVVSTAISIVEPYFATTTERAAMRSSTALGYIFGQIECSAEIPSPLHGWTRDLPSHAQITDMTLISDIQSQRHEDEEQEKARHRFPLAVLLEVDPQNYQCARFTTEATIYKINTLKPWSCISFKICKPSSPLLGAFIFILGLPMNRIYEVK